MTPTIHLNYGHGAVRVAYVDHADVLTIDDPRPVVTPNRLAADLDPVLAGRPLDGRRIAVVVADKTRLCGYDRYLPVLLERLQAAGADPTRVTVYIAYGTHPRQSDAESRVAYGEAYTGWRFVHHDCTDRALFADLGRTRRGTPIRLRRDLLDADIVVTFGAVAHHYFAGFGGGRKLIFPGLGERTAIYHNHGLFLDAQRRMLAEGCQTGRLAGNPLAEDLAEIEAYRPADVALHGLLNSRGQVCRILVGSGTDPFHRACEAHGRHCERHAPAGSDLVVASCGGMPKDINFIQAHKAVHHAAAFVNDGGRLIILGQCPDGVGSTTFLPWFEMGWDAAFDHLTHNYQGNGGTALAMMAKTRRIRIDMVTDLPAAVCRTIGVGRCDVQSVVDRLARASGRIAVIPNASLLVRRPSGGLTGSLPFADGGVGCLRGPNRVTQSS